ncbi:MAG: DMT family transporter [Aestuariivirga sp.]
MESQNQLRGIAAMLLSGITFVINDSLMKIAMEGVPPYEVLVLRGLAGAFFAIIYLAYRGELKWRPELTSTSVLLRAGMECTAVLFYIIALAHAPIGDVTALFQTTPLLVILGLIILHGEKASTLRLGLVLVGFLGALLVAQPGHGTVSSYAMLALVTAVFAAGRDLAARKIAAEVPAMLSTFVLILTVLCGATICCLLFETWVMPPLTLLVAPLVAGLFMMLGHHFTLVAYRLAKAQTVAPFYYSFMVFAVIVGYFLFSDVPNIFGLIGMAIIVLSGLAILAIDKGERADVFQSPDL